MKRWVAIAVLSVGWICVVSAAYSSAQDDRGETGRKVANRIMPVYPALARSMGIRGSVKVDVVVAPNGTVRSVEVKGGHPMLVQAAADAVRKWKWVPASKETKEPVTVKFDPNE